MKRDMDLVREILLAVEAAPTHLRTDLELEGRDPVLVREHVKLLKQVGFLNEPYLATNYRVHTHFGTGLTWEGYEFLETVRDPQVWITAKSGAAKLGSWSLSVLAELAKAALKAKAIELGVPLDPS